MKIHPTFYEDAEKEKEINIAKKELKKENYIMKNLKNFTDFVNEEFGEIDREHEYLVNNTDIVHGRFLDLEKVSNGLWIHLNDHGKKENEEEDNLIEQNFCDYFEDIAANSEWKYIDNLGEAGFGLTGAPGITYGYEYIDDDVVSKPTEGPTAETSTDDNGIYYYNNYMITDFTDKLKEEGKVFFQKN